MPPPARFPSGRFATARLPSPSSIRLWIWAWPRLPSNIPSRTTALLNAASAIVADGNLVGNGTLAERFAEAYKLAEETVDSGKAEALFDKWIETAKSKA